MSRRQTPTSTREILAQTFPGRACASAESATACQGQTGKATQTPSTRAPANERASRAHRAPQKRNEKHLHHQKHQANRRASLAHMASRERLAVPRKAHTRIVKMPVAQNKVRVVRAARSYHRRHKLQICCGGFAHGVGMESSGFSHSCIAAPSHPSMAPYISLTDTPCAES